MWCHSQQWPSWRRGRSGRGVRLLEREVKEEGFGVGGDSPQGGGCGDVAVTTGVGDRED